MIVAFWILVGLSVAIICLSFAMAPDSNSYSGALVGSSDLDLFKQSRERGTKKFLKWAMMWFGLVFMIIAVVIRILA